ncbi:cryptochrome/photolyase family protein [Gluconobacter aidae]|uniref:cryptochrome/photolyase family protein n=1 Tax=Gluconobacter aidae TaxID=2662454 RepID=UPI001E407F63|nr:cryptochrome/photolyase family protein [Gluconobacter aidae]
MKRIVLVLGDQLTPTLSSLLAADRENDVVLMAEVVAEATYIRHHKKKIVLVLAAMRHFAAELRAAGWRVDYVTLLDPANSGSLHGEVMRAFTRHGATHVLVTEPGEWRLMREMAQWPSVTLLPDDRFLADRHGFASWAENRRGLRMEHFCRLMRLKTGLLMEGDQPAGGRWNFDRDNRKPAPGALALPGPLRFEPDAITRDVLEMVATRFPDHFGELNPFWFAVTRAGAEAAFAHFLRHGLEQ